MLNVGRLLDAGARTLMENARARENTARIRAETRGLLLTYRGHRLRRISGGDGSDLRARVRSLRKPHETTRLHIGSCPKPKSCDVCGKPILVGDDEVEIENGGRTFRLDRECFKLWQEAAG